MCMMYVCVCMYVHICVYVCETEGWGWRYVCVCVCVCICPPVWLYWLNSRPHKCLCGNMAVARTWGLWPSSAPLWTSTPTSQVQPWHSQWYTEYLHWRMAWSNLTFVTMATTRRSGVGYGNMRQHICSSTKLWSKSHFTCRHANRNNGHVYWKNIYIYNINPGFK